MQSHLIEIEREKMSMQKWQSHLSEICACSCTSIVQEIRVQCDYVKQPYSELICLMEGLGRFHSPPEEREKTC